MMKHTQSKSAAWGMKILVASVLILSAAWRLPGRARCRKNFKTSSQAMSM